MNTKDKKENKIIFIGLGLILLVLFITIGKNYLSDNKKSDSTKKIVKEEVYKDYEFTTPKELGEKIIKGEKIALIDIRDKVNFDKNHIENSINISPENFDETLGRLNKDQSIVIISYDYDRQKDVGAVIKKLKTDLEFKNVTALTGGVLGWIEEANPIISGGNKESAIDWSKIDYIIPEQLKLAIDNDYPVFILDVRTGNQFALGHIPKAVNIPLAELEKRKSEIPMTKEILVYGENSDEDFKAGVKLNDLNFLATYTLKGGFNAWKEKSFGLER